MMNLTCAVVLAAVLCSINFISADEEELAEFRRIHSSCFFLRENTTNCIELRKCYRQIVEVCTSQRDLMILAVAYMNRVKAMAGSQTSLLENAQAQVCSKQLAWLNCYAGTETPKCPNLGRKLGAIGHSVLNRLYISSTLPECQAYAAWPESMIDEPLEGFHEGVEEIARQVEKILPK